MSEYKVVMSSNSRLALREVDESVLELSMPSDVHFGTAIAPSLTSMGQSRSSGINDANLAALSDYIDLKRREYGG